MSRLYNYDRERLLYFYKEMQYNIENAASAPRIEELMMEIFITTMNAILSTFGEPDKEIERKLQFMNEAQQAFDTIRKYQVEKYDE